MGLFNLNNINFSQFNPSVIQNTFKILNYIQGNIKDIQKVIQEDPNLTSPEAIRLLDELGAIKYQNKSYLDRQNIVRKEIQDLLPEFKDKLK